MNVEAIILSKTSDVNHYGLTCRTINSLNNSIEWNGSINIIESEPTKIFQQNGFMYPNCNVIFPEIPFNYNKFLNIGISNLKDDTDWILICNNDLFFTPSWWKNMKNVVSSVPEILSFSPLAPNADVHQNIPSVNIIEGYHVPVYICGWCILMHRSLVKICELFDERFQFWYQDNDYSYSLQSKNIRHGLVPISRVYHMASSSHDLLDDQNEMTVNQQAIFFKKWNRYG